MNILGMFARRPEPGRTKTRLAAGVGDTVAADLYAAFADDLLQRCPDLADRFLLAATPDDESTRNYFTPRLASNGTMDFQPETDFGQRIDWGFYNMAQADAAGMVLIGSDSPDLPSGIITDAFRCLDQIDVVISPATDGGYVLIGLRQPQPGLFDSVRWSSAFTLHDTVAAAQQRGLSVELLRPWYDIDVVENLGTLRMLQEFPACGAAACPLTVAVLRKYWPQISQAAESAGRS